MAKNLKQSLSFALMVVLIFILSHFLLYTYVSTGPNLDLSFGWLELHAQTFKFTRGTPRSFNKQKHSWSPTRHFCEVCGVHLTARSERAPGAVLVKVGTLDDPSVFQGPRLVTWTSEMQAFHLLPPDVPAFAEIPRPPSQPKNA